MRPLMLVLLLAACASSGREDVSSFDALRRHERGEVLVIDVRSAAEVFSAFPKRHLTHIQFGPQEWSAVSEADVSAFVDRLAPLMSEGKPVFLLCQYGVRSGTAARLLAGRGVSVMSIADGYLGNSHGPGWQAWE